MQKIIALILVHLTSTAQSNPAEECISSICGPPAQSNLFQTQYDDQLFEYLRLGEDQTKVDFPPEISKMVSELYVEKNKNNQLILSQINKTNEPDTGPLNGISKALYNYAYATPFLKKLKFKERVIDGTPLQYVDEQATLEELKNLSPKEQNWILQLGKYVTARMNEDGPSRSEVDSQPTNVLLKLLHSDLNVKGAMQAEINQTQSSLASLKNISPLEKTIFFLNTSPDRLNSIAAHVANETVDENETREIIQWNKRFKLINDLYINPNSPLQKRDTPSAEEVIKEAGGTEALSQWVSNQNGKEYKRKIQACKMRYFLNMHLLPDQHQINRLNQDILRAKQLVREMIKSKFPSSMQQKLIQAVDDSSFTAPPTRNQFRSNFTKSIRQNLATQKAQDAEHNILSPNEIRKFTAVGKLNNTDEDDTEDDLNEYCDAFQYAGMSDGNYLTLGSIVLSYTTATGNEPSRMKTLMHELGHSVLKAISKNPQFSQQMASVNKCLADQHTEAVPPKTKERFENANLDSPTTEGPYGGEDFPDTVAGESGRTLSGRNLWCQFLTLRSDRQQYQDFSMQATDGDEHSASLFRLLNFETIKRGVVPESCKTFFKTVKFKEHFNSCFDLTGAQKPGQSVNTVR